MIPTSRDSRSTVVDFLRRHLFGPLEGPQETVERDSPSFRYTVGVLFPKDLGTESVLDEESVDEGSGATGDLLTDDPVTLANQKLPASVGLSFVVKGTDSVQCHVHAATYVRDGARWTRNPVSTPSDPEIVSLSPAEPGKPCLGGRATLTSVWRPLPDGWLVTVALVNAATAGQRQSVHDAAECLFQVGLEIRLTSGTFHAYPSIGRSFSDEDQEIQLQYRGKVIYGIGHGSAADWGPERPDGTPEAVRVDFLPAVDVPPVVRHSGDDECLILARLADSGWSALIPSLRAFADRYAAWIATQDETARSLPRGYGQAPDRILARLRAAHSRIHAGIDLLERDADARRAFRLANLAMLMQMRHGEPDLGGTDRTPASRVRFPGPEDYLEMDKYRWYPFQLAFILLSVTSLMEKSSEPTANDRDLVDLIWFPTGGGKTEAYLAVAAMQIALRRMHTGDRSGGTAVISRYTLRLLTSQQYRRTAALACALEWLRIDGRQELTGDPITVGLWIGEGTPWRCDEARETLEALREDRSPVSPFQLERCPWCGTRLVPKSRSDDPDSYGFHATNSEFRIRCVRTACPFNERLPVQIVDEMLYREPPTILIGTVDKFARLAWVAEAGALLGGEQHDPPSLIIQDEMHLLGGPLGTTFGVYETAIDVACRLRGGRPKIIASTATIRGLAHQASGLFGREARVFPPPGLDAADSYYARVDSDAPGRMYLGVLSPHHTPTTTLIRTSALLALAPVEVELDDASADAYWTQVVYHNSLRELGHFITQARDDVPGWIGVIAADESRARSISDHEVIELSSNVSRLDGPSPLTRLERPRGHEDAVSIAASTNMFSVGVDVPRLGLMLVNGQPKTTSEYIQATSRVGRGDVPGLVVTHLSGSKPRDRSHYEGFRGYHEALYRHVEPTSVSPFAIPSRLRALHAALVIVVRHGLGLRGNEQADQFDASKPEHEAAVSLLAERAARADPDEKEATRRYLVRLTESWREQAEHAGDRRSVLHYNTQSTLPSLIRNFGEPGKGWETLQSMRNVDRQCDIEIIGTGMPL